MAVWEPPRGRDSAGPAPAPEHAMPLPSPRQAAASFPAFSAGRLLAFGGIALIVLGMLFGDIFAVFILHQNGGQTGHALLAATQAVSAHHAAAVNDIFAGIGGLLEDRGTKVDAHVHMTDAGYLALVLALIQPYVALKSHRKKTLARIFLLGGVCLPLGIFLIHYVGLAYSPFAVIGWASVVADSAGALMILSLAGFGWGVWSYFRSRRASSIEPELLRDRSWERHALLAGGTLLVLLGFVDGAWYSAKYLYQHERMETTILANMIDSAAAQNSQAATQTVSDYGSLQAEKAVHIAAHSHLIEFGLLAILLSFVQPYVFLGQVWKRRWVMILLSGGLILPVFVLLELKFGLVAGGIADFGGLMVIAALLAMLVGVLRGTGGLDAYPGEAA